MSDAATVEFLATVPLLEGTGDADLAALAGVLRRRTVREGELLWRQGDPAKEMVFVVAGAASALLHVSGDRTVEVWRAGRGDTMGEISLLDGHGHTLTARVHEEATLLSLGRAQYAALVAGQEPWVASLRRQLARRATGIVRSQLERLAGPRGEEADGRGAADALRTFAELGPSGAPDSRYVRRMATFHDLDPLALWGYLTSGSYVLCPPGRTLLAEGAPPTACFLTMNGAVETVLLRGDRRVRIAVAGPGRTFGHEGLVDGLPSPFTAITRERSLLLVIPPGPFSKLFHGTDAASRAFLDVILRELVAASRQTLRGHARLAVSV
jgi:CRP-like cAMP-binding protein